MNISLLVFSLTAIWAPFAVPEGTDGFALASGTIGTCTASGFFQITLTLTIPVYYVSLSLQAYMGFRNGFKEEKYVWIEKWAAGKENINPAASMCRIAKAPVGCEDNPDVPCERGDLQKLIHLILALSLIFLYFIFPPAVTISMQCWIRKCKKRAEASSSTGWLKIKESARTDMMKNVTKQISSFWLTWILELVHVSYHTLTNKYVYGGVKIASNLIFYLQGCVYAIVYFQLERMAKPKVYTMTKRNPNTTSQLTVEQIRANAERKQSSTLESEGSESDRSKVDLTFNIFDGQPDPNSPWAKFIYDDSDDEEEEHRDNHANSS
eukprot:scaffold82592_cov67-Cyclotella_meneghiniana.AAC.12